MTPRNRERLEWVGIALLVAFVGIPALVIEWLTTEKQPRRFRWPV